ncbi:hypothetical protein IC234_08670 [Hymenobacter sp. BT189]|uniref:REase associating with pPIWI RE domain-containing protein n=2 Tax=Hymenobacter armeniacus TaxID=2771358 RepID=A0ABR8JWV0_9BACT|nr:hypothetical protein [Hymenobacter armeniacus]
MSTIVARLRELGMEDLAAALTQKARIELSDSPSAQRVEQAAILLAYGILKQFQAVRAGYPVGVGLSHPNPQIAATAIPLELRQAQTHLARLAIGSGQVDVCASVHELLAFCTRPLRDWAPLPLQTDERYASVVLINQEYHVPTQECGDLAELGGHLADIVEKQLYKQLRTGLDKLDDTDRPAAYTLVRQFVATHPMATWSELATVYRHPLLNKEITDWLRVSYEPVHAHLANRQGYIPRCGHCRAPLVHPADSRHGSALQCQLSGCRAMHPQPQATPNPLKLGDTYLARPELLQYWCSPALEELRLYRELSAIFSPAEEVHLYPFEDKCDVAVGLRFGIDVKDYHDPVRLAHKLNHRVEGLHLYEEVVIAVAQRQVRNRPEYLQQVREQLHPKLARRIHVLAVDDLIHILRTRGRLD